MEPEEYSKPRPTEEHEQTDSILINKIAVALSNSKFFVYNEKATYTLAQKIYCIIKEKVKFGSLDDYVNLLIHTIEQSKEFYDKKRVIDTFYEDIDALNNLPKEDPEEDLRILMDIFKNYTEPGGFTTHFQLYKDLLLSSNDLQRYCEYIKKVYNANKGNSDSRITEKIPQEIIQLVESDHSLLDSVLYLKEQALKHGYNAFYLLRTLSSFLPKDITNEDLYNIGSLIENVTQHARIIFGEMTQKRLDAIVGGFSSHTHQIFHYQDFFNALDLALYVAKQTPEEKLSKVTDEHNRIHDYYSQIDNNIIIARIALMGHKYNLNDPKDLQTLTNFYLEDNECYQKNKHWADSTWNQRNKYPRRNSDALTGLQTMHGLLHFREDVFRYIQFAERLRIYDIDSTNFVLTHIDNMRHIWKNLYRDSSSFDQLLHTIESVMEQGQDIDTFMNLLGSISQGELRNFMQKAEELTSKHIPLSFILENLDELNLLDLSQEGITILPDPILQKKLLEYCSNIWLANPLSIRYSARFFQDAIDFSYEDTKRQYNNTDMLRTPYIRHASMFDKTERQELFEDLNYTPLIDRGHNKEQQEVKAQAYELIQRIVAEAANNICNSPYSKKVSISLLQELKTHLPSSRYFVENVDNKMAKQIAEEKNYARYIFGDNTVLAEVFPQACQAHIFLEITHVNPFFDEITKIVESHNILTEELIQQAYEKLLSQYVETNEIRWSELDDEPEEYLDQGESFLYALKNLETYTNIVPHYNKENVYKLYIECCVNDTHFHHKLNTLITTTGISLDEPFIQTYILDNRSFCSYLSQEISLSLLESHFKQETNRTPQEYIRIYKIFGCYDYYQNVLSTLEQQDTLQAKKEIIGLLAAMGLRETEKNNEDRYNNIKTKIFEYGTQNNKILDKTVAYALSELATNEDGQIITHFVDILKQNVQEEEKRINGLSEQQEIALRTLLELDMPRTNEALLSFLFLPNIHPRIKRVVANNLIYRKKDFFPPNVRDYIINKLQEDSKNNTSKFEWNDLTFIQSTLRIPNADLRKKAIEHVNSTMQIFKEKNETPFHKYKEICPDIPKNIFLPLYKFVKGNDVILKKFNELYKRTKGSTQQEALLFGIVNVLEIDDKIQTIIVKQLHTINFQSSDASTEMAKMFKLVSFLNNIGQQLSEYGISLQETIDTFNSSVQSVAELNNSLEKLLVTKIKKILPNDAIDTDKIQMLWKEWGNLEPIFIYASKMAKNSYDGTLKLVAEMVSHIDPPTYQDWKKWRYNEKNEKVHNQIDHLTQEQRETWIADHFAELGDIVIATSPTDRPKRVINHIRTAILQRHIYNPEVDSSHKYQFIQQTLSDLLTTIEGKHIDTNELLQGKILELFEHKRILDTYLKLSEEIKKFSQLETRITKWRDKEEEKRKRREKAGINLDTILDEIQTLTEQITPYLQTVESGKGTLFDQYYQQLKQLNKTYANKRKDKKDEDKQSLENQRYQEEKKLGLDIFGPEYEDILAVNKRLQLLTSVIPQEIDSEVQRLLEKYNLTHDTSNERFQQTLSGLQKKQEEISQNDFFSRYGLDPKQKNIKPLRDKHAELKATIDLLQLMNINSSLIAKNQISEHTNKKGETISSVINSLKKFFQDNQTFLQDLDNIQTAVTHKEDIGTNRHLAMIITDNPQMLFQVGKYPTGCGSCQNYEGSPDWNKALAGYVADAHIKVAFLIDLNKLPPDIRQGIKTSGFEQMKDFIPTQNLLEASIGRSILKIVKLNSGTALFIEPTYTQMNKDDFSMNIYVDLFAKLMVSNPMNIALVRGAGEEIVTVPASRNPNGQYEDAAAGNHGNAGMGIQKGTYTMSARIIK